MESVPTFAWNPCPRSRGIRAHDHVEYAARGGAAEVLEGGRPLKRTVLLEFPDMPTLKAFYRSPEYQPLLALRQASSQSEVLIFDGVPQEV